jgi:hypothetical protein
MFFSKRSFYFSLILSLSLLMMAAGLMGCNGNNTTDPSNGESAVALTIVNGDNVNDLTFSQLKAMSQVEDWGGFMTSVGTINGPNRYKGVLVEDLLETVGGLESDEAIRVVGKDGYGMTLSNMQANGEGLIVFDGITGEEVEPPPLRLVVVYQENGDPIEPKVGPLRLGIFSSESTVTEGHWWIKWLNRIEVVSDILPWELSLSGGIDFNLDNGYFNSCTTADCHGVSWEDQNGNVYQGVPLWRLAGWVDDEQMHEKGLAFNDDLADAGYEIELTAADGYAVRLSSDPVKRNQGIIVAHLMNDDQLGPDHWPIRLLGDELAKNQKISQIVSLRLIFPDQE